MKKYIVAALAGLSLLTVPALAKTEVISSVDASNRVTINIKSDRTSEAVYTVMILNAGADIDASYTGNAINNVYKIETVKGADKAGLSFNMKAADPRGVYKFVVGGGELSEYKGSFAVPESGELSSALSALNGANASTVYGVLNQYNNVAWTIDFTSPSYTADSSEVLRSFVKMGAGAFTSGADVHKHFRNACILSEIRRAEENEVLARLNEYKEELGMTYSEIVASGQEEVMRAFTYLAADKAKNPVNSIAELDTLLKRAEALGKVNAATRQDLESVLNTYSSVLGISLTGDYKTVDTYEVIKLLIKESGAEYTSLKEFGDAFISAVAEVKKKETAVVRPQGGGGGTGGGGGGSFGGGGYGGGNKTGITPSLNVNDPSAAVGTKENDESGTFSDVPSDNWAKDYIEYAAYKGVMAGDGNGRFRPGDKIKREEFLKVAIEAMALGKGEALPPIEVPYKDIAEDDWCMEYIKKGIYYKVINGVSADFFGKGQTLTRQDAAVILMRVKEASGMVLTEEDTEAVFTDEDSIAGYALESVQKLKRAKILNGYETGEFRPRAGISRAEAAKIIYGILKNTNSL